MRDIVSNVLTRAEHIPGSEVNAFLKDSQKQWAAADDLLKAAAEHFRIDPERLAESVEHWRHINCEHAAVPGYAVPDALREATAGGSVSSVPVSVFAADVTLHVVLHELGHAVIREFDLMVLGNEETMADAFATHLLTEHFPEHAVSAISARVKSLMIEANEVPRDQWTVRGEHDNDARRAFQIAALAVAADKEKFSGVAKIAGMSEEDIKNARDYGSDIHRAWRRTLSPLMMPAGRVSNEARFRADGATRAFVDAGEPGLASTIESALQRFDWHSRVTVDFVGGPGGAGWNRSKRTITVNSEYLQRFVAQGVKAEAQAASGEPPPVLPVKSPPSLEGTRVTVALNRSALGVSTLNPISRQTGTYNGVEVSVSGHVVAQTERFLVLSQAPPAGHEQDRALHWFPLTSILSIRQEGETGPAEPLAEAPPEPWRLEALHNLMGMVAFPLKDLPQGELEVWFEKDGKKDYLDSVDTAPGFDQWLQIGVDPVNHTAVIMSVVSEENKGFSQVSLPAGPLTPLHKTVKPGHNWLESAVIAEEGSGDGRVHARLKPKG